MKLDLNQLSALAYANGYTRWHYRTEHHLADMVQTGYFNNAAGMLRVGDRIDVTCGDVLAELGVTRNHNGRIEVGILGNLAAIW